MFDLHQSYPYLEEVNPGILRLLPVRRLAEGERLSVLDVGCGRAALGAALAQRGYEVWGIESSHEAVRMAAARISKLIPADLTRVDEVSEGLGGRKFDYVIFSDVLEHVYDPLQVLKDYRRFLKPGGRILISLPNVANWETRIKLLFGFFNYASTGVMDRTHIRFFTFRTARLLVEEAGMKVDRTDCDPYLVRAFLPIIKAILAPSQGQGAHSSTLLDSPFYRLYSRWVYPVEYQVTRLWKSLLSFRIILEAVE